MRYRVGTEWSGLDRYGLSVRKKGVVFVDAGNKREARRLAKMKCLIGGLLEPSVGKAVMYEQHLT